MKAVLICTILLMVTVTLCSLLHASSVKPQLQTASRVDIARYMGGWHEIARLEHLFQKNCVGSFAEYRLRPDGEVDVLNSCIDEKTGKRREAKGHAWSVDPVDNSKLKVSFFWPFRGDYWIIELGENYDYSVVGSPDRKYLWILGREPVVDEALYGEIVERLRRQGFPVDNLVRRPLKTISGNAKLQ